MSHVPRYFSYIFFASLTIFFFEESSAQETIGENTSSPNYYSIGDFRLQATADVSEYYDTNIFSTRNNTIDDFITTVSPGVSLQSNWDEHGLNVKAGGTVGRHSEYGGEDYEDYYIGTDAFFDIDKLTKIFGGLQYNHLHESRESPDDVFGNEPTEYDLIEGHLGARHQWQNTALQIGGTLQDYNYDDVNSDSGLINNDDRDRGEYEFGARLSRSAKQLGTTFVQGIYNTRDYENAVDDSGFNRDSNGWGAGIGSQFSPGKDMSLEMAVGWLLQQYDDPGFSNISTPDADILFSWQVSPATKAGFTLGRKINETTLSGASGYVSTDSKVNLSHYMTKDVVLDVHANYSKNDYKGVARVDDLVGVGFGERYYFMPNFYTEVGYDFLHRDSDQAGEDFHDNKIYISFGTALNPYKSPSTITNMIGDGNGDFFLGLQAGHGSTFTGLNGPRGMGTLTADFGDHGAIYGAFAGYDYSFGSWFSGVEVDIDKGHMDWDHDNSGGRFFRVTRKESYGIGLRGGYEQDSGVQYYGRTGLAFTRFDTDYQTASNTNFETDEFALGFRFGGGIEAPVDSASFVRMDYGYTTYEDYNFTVPSGTDNFHNGEVLMRLGLGYRFGGKEPEIAQGNPENFAGLFMGGNLGYGLLSSRNEGPRSGGSTLLADRGSHGGTGGVFGGYGIVFGNMYAGAEGEGELSYADWNIDRDPEGRLYSARKDWTVGGAVRLGYIVNGNTLLYGKAGPVISHVSSEYSEGANNVSQNDNLSGLRVGGGIEVASGDASFVRMDYTYTEYEDYEVNYSSGTDGFKPTETMMRLGFGYRF